MIRSKNNKITYILILLLLGITLGYAYLNTTLNINGTTNITSANWSIYWDNIQFGTNNVTDVTTPATISSGLTEVTFNVNFKEPGDTYEFTVDAVNDGSINAMISVVNSGVYAANGTTPKTLPAYLEYTVTYSDGVTIAQNDLLEAGDTETYKVRVHYKEDISASQLPSTNDNYMFKFSVTYAQATATATPVNHPQTVYTANVWDGNDSTMNDGTNTSLVWIGQAIPNGITTYQTPTLAMAALKQASGNVDRPFFLKHTVTNNIVTDSYVGFVITPEMANANVGMTAGTYYLKGKKTYEYVNNDWQCMSEYDDGNGNCLDPDYNANKATLLSAFGSPYCTEYSYSFGCHISDLGATVNSYGYMFAYGDSWSCYVDSSGSSGCSG